MICGDSDAFVYSCAGAARSLDYRDKIPIFTLRVFTRATTPSMAVPPERFVYTAFTRRHYFFLFRRRALFHARSAPPRPPPALRLSYWRCHEVYAYIRRLICYQPSRRRRFDRRVNGMAQCYALRATVAVTVIF